jgi:energy-coupling factor transport system permease protein
MTVFTVWSYLLLTRIPGNIQLVTWPWGDYVTESTVYVMLAQIFRWQALALSSILFLSTVTDSDIIDVMQFFRIPYTVSFMLSLTIRSVSMFLGDWTTIKEAMTSKGVDFQTGNPISKVRKQLFVMWPLVYLIFSRVREIAFAIESRGFGSFKKRTRYRVITWNPIDWVAIIVCIAAIASLVVLHFVMGLNLPLTV